jgi:hypothetical protein
MLTATVRCCSGGSGASSRAWASFFGMLPIGNQFSGVAAGQPPSAADHAGIYHPVPLPAFLAQLHQAQAGYFHRGNNSEGLPGQSALLGGDRAAREVSLLVEPCGVMRVLFRR